MNACAGRLTGAALALLVLGVPACAKKHELNLEVTREVVIHKPAIQEVTFEPGGLVDTTDAGRTINVRMHGDDRLQATFDVDGRIKGQKMEEIQPGVYSGSFDVKQGEEGKLWVTGRLKHPTLVEASQELRGAEPLELRTTPKLPEDLCDAASVEEFDRALQALTTHFEFNKFTLTTEARAALYGGREILASHEKCGIEVHGYADEVGSPAYNMELSKNRATSIAGYLESFGIPIGRMAVQFHGEEQPVDTTGTPEGRALNRRVELHAAGPR
jgi:outer membrane protein OmpA-like peptidoglycan-associated protein